MRLHKYQYQYQPNRRVLTALISPVQTVAVVAAEEDGSARAMAAAGLRAKMLLLMLLMRSLPHPHSRSRALGRRMLGAKQRRRECLR